MARIAPRAVLAAVMALAAAAPAMAGQARPVCLQTSRIDHTTHPDDRTLMIHMANRKVYKATMVNACVGLRNSIGFSYSPTNPNTNEICSNLLSIRLRDSGQTCLVGEIVPVDAPAR